MLMQFSFCSSYFYLLNSTSTKNRHTFCTLTKSQAILLLVCAKSTNSKALRALYLVSHHIAETNKSFTIGEELIGLACTDICGKVLGESAGKKRAQFPLSARTVARRIEDLAQDIETQLLE